MWYVMTGEVKSYVRGVLYMGSRVACMRVWWSADSIFLLFRWVLECFKFV